MDGTGRLSANYLTGGYRYVVLKKSEDTVKLQALNFKVYDTVRVRRRNKRKDFLNKRTLDKSILSQLYNDRIFSIKKDDFESAAVKSEYTVPDRFVIGVLTLPFRFRLQGKKSYESSFNVNTTLGVRLFPLGNSNFYGQIGAGIGGVYLDSENAAGIEDDSSISANALSMLTGVMLQYKKVQAGLYLGTDFINNQTHYKWKYQGKPWFSLGIGYQLFNIGSKDKSTERN